MSHDPEVPPPGAAPGPDAAVVPASPLIYLLLGLGIQVVGALVYLNAEGQSDLGVGLGLVLGGLGGLVLLVGVVAAGVVVGLRYHQHGATRP